MKMNECHDAYHGSRNKLVKSITCEHGAVTQEILVESLGSELGGSTQISLGIA